ncbi:PhzF family phenazine biosynthesis protein [Flavobacterium poyangense]|uniref:PhzF family phenazine biosynthesis protein n=1 Tax=Flavobacterium poyangense TaxID=2204302 RepID=UPI001421FB25|nr:PhzF family phenazine biosynthesis protein [Flavobacterium sp. JXAS1]
MKVFIIDAFTDKAFKGNPAGVCLVESEINRETMQAIAGELNLSETAFLRQSESGDTDYSIQYFTPTVEIDFCGHATLAAAKLVLHHLNKPFVNFTTFHNLKVHAASEGDSIKMKFPLYNAIEYVPNKELYEAFGIDNPIVTKFAKELDMLLIEISDKTTLLNIKPDFVKAIPSSDVIKEVVVTAKSEDTDYDFYSRCFCPWIGINEDPVTGASHSVLAKYWGQILGKTEMRAYQTSERGGFMQLKIISDTELEVVSNAKIIIEGRIHVD